MRAFRERLMSAVVPRVGYAYIRLTRLTMRIEYRGREVLAESRRKHGQYILAFWHSRFVMMPFCYPDRRLVVLSSRHRDSMMLSEILRRFGLSQAWGSSSEGGARGMRQLLRFVRDGYDVGFTPDGPKGPRRRLKPGVVAVARLSGLPVIPVGFAARPARRLGSWDRTLLPLPFARGLFLYGRPLLVPRDADADAQESWAGRIEEALDQVTDEADRQIGFPVEEPVR